MHQTDSNRAIQRSIKKTAGRYKKVQLNIDISRCYDVTCRNKPIYFDETNIGYCLTHLTQEAIKL
jgi:hypothetical protein